MTAAQVIEAARLLTSGAVVNHPDRVVVFTGEGSHGVYMCAKPLPRKGGRSLKEEWAATKRWLIERDGTSREQTRP